MRKKVIWYNKYNKIIKNREAKILYFKPHDFWDFKIREFFKNKERHQFHLVGSSQLPILTAFSAMLLAMSVVFYWHPSSDALLSRLDNILMHIAFIAFTFVLLSWFISIVRESQAGDHTAVVQRGLRLGVILFIVSEIFFFFAFFWAFFHFSLAPSIFIGCVWPPKGIQPLDVWGLPLVNTLLLLSSGITITFAHHVILKAETPHQHKIFAKHLLATIILGVTFLICQGIEYKYGITFSWKENVYGSIFFITTGFHGFHVTFGTVVLWFCLVRTLLTTAGLELLSWNGDIFNFIWAWKKVKWIRKRRLKHEFHKRYEYWCDLRGFQCWISTFGFSPKQHLGFEAAAWYWHFVDVVWLFLFVTVYWWGS